MNLQDHGNPPMTLLRRLYYPLNRFTYWLYDFAAGIERSESTISVLKRFGRPVLLITTGAGFEQKIGRVYQQTLGDAVTLWEIPDARHGGGYFYDVKAYQEKVVRFFEKAFTVT